MLHDVILVFLNMAAEAVTLSACSVAFLSSKASYFSALANSVAAAVAIWSLDIAIFLQVLRLNK